MKKGRFSEEQIIGILKRHEAGQKVADLAREHGISEATIYTWKGKYGGMEVSEAQRLKSLEDENRRLKHLVADLSLDKEVLKAVISKNGWARSSTARCRACRGNVRYERTQSLRAGRCRAIELPLSAEAGWRREAARALGGVSVRAAAFRLSAARRVAGARRHAYKSQTAVSCIPRSRPKR